MYQQQSVDEDYPESPLKINLKPTLKNDSTLNTYNSSKVDLHNFNPSAPKVRIQVSNRNQKLNSPRNHKIQDFFDSNLPYNTTLKKIESPYLKNDEKPSVSFANNFLYKHYLNKFQRSSS